MREWDVQGRGPPVPGEAQTPRVLFAGRRKKASGRRKAQPRSSVKSRSSGARSKKRQGRVKKRKGNKSKVGSDGVVAMAVVPVRSRCWDSETPTFLKNEHFCSTD